MSFLAKSTVNEQYFTVSQTLNWLYLIDRFSSIRRKALKERIDNNDVVVGNYKWIRELLAEQYGSVPLMK